MINKFVHLYGQVLAAAIRHPKWYVRLPAFVLVVLFALPAWLASKFYRC